MYSELILKEVNVLPGFVIGGYNLRNIIAVDTVSVDLEQY